MMDEHVVGELERAAEEYDVSLINARERGSRMLGVSHDDSDWDVMFLFADRPVEYAKTAGGSRVIDWPHVGPSGEIDLHGWNVEKFGELLLDSNPNAVEYCIPSKEYVSAPDSVDFTRVEYESEARANLMSLYHHYISMAKSNYEKYVASGNDCTKGRQFYVARAIACAHYVRTQDSVPPMDVDTLLESEALDAGMETILRRLTEAKRSGRGEQETPDIVGTLYDAESDALMAPTEPRINKPDREIIDTFIEEAVRHASVE